MNAIDFGYTNDRDHTRGICQWVSDKEWCATPLVVEHYRGSFNTPANYNYGALYGIDMPDGIPTQESMWICPSHRFQFLFANGIKDGSLQSLRPLCVPHFRFVEPFAEFNTDSST